MRWLSTGLELLNSFYKHGWKKAGFDLCLVTQANPTFFLFKITTIQSKKKQKQLLATFKNQLFYKTRTNSSYWWKFQNDDHALLISRLPTRSLHPSFLTRAINGCQIQSKLKDAFNQNLVKILTKSKANNGCNCHYILVKISG